MNTRFVKLAEKTRTSMWVIPALCTVIAAVLAFAMIRLDASGQDFRLPWNFEGGVDSARAVLSTIAGSMITVAGTIYSITFVVLVLASQQFTPRLLRNFMRDRGNQVVLGLFVATFAYCLLVLRAVRDADEGLFVPHSAITIGIVLALISLAMLIYFIDHLSHSVQISSMLANVVHETIAQIDYLYPLHWGEPGSAVAPGPSAPLPDSWGVVRAQQSGYLQYVDYDALLRAAVEAGVVLREDYLMGDFIIRDSPLAYIAPPAAINPQLARAINDSIVVGNSPTLQQDVAYGLRQIVDVALKAISPAVNDPTTAINCIDQIGAILGVLGGRSMPERDRRDAQGTTRVIVRERSFADYVRLAFTQITHFGAADPTIVLRMIRVIGQLGRTIRHQPYREVLCRQFEIIAAAAQRSIADPHEHEIVDQHIAAARAELTAAKNDPALTNQQSR